MTTHCPTTRKQPAISRRTGLSIWGLAILTTIGMGSKLTIAGDEPPAQVDQPNIVFFLADDMRWDALSCVGNRVLRTPNLDRLARQGTLFRNCFCTTSICCVSRASFLTGQYERRHGINDFATPLNPEALARTYPMLLRQAGYYTGLVGKWGLGGAAPKKDFDFWQGYEGQGFYYEKNDPVHLTRKLTRHALNFLEGAPKDKPFLLCMCYKAPHCQDGAKRQFPPDKDLESAYANDVVPVPPTATPEAFEIIPDFLKTSIGRERWKLRFANPQMYQATVKDYFRLVTGLDRSVGMILNELGRKGRLGNTVIIFSSDNGFYLGEHGLAGKWFMHEESIRLPLIIHDPRLGKDLGNRSVDQMALNIDVAPTILDLAGVSIPKQMQGRSLRPIVAGKKPQWREDFYYEHHVIGAPRIPEVEGVREQRYSYMRYIKREPVVEELFDLEKDPMQIHNLANDPGSEDAMSRLRNRWQILSKEAG